jgi:hypothetical protein
MMSSSEAKVQAEAGLAKLAADCLEGRQDLNESEDTQSQKWGPTGSNKAYAEDCFRHGRDNHALRLDQLKKAAGKLPS